VATTHVHALYRHGSTPVHRVAPQVKIVVAFGALLAIVSTPREAIWAFVLYAVLVCILAAVAGITPGFAARRLTIEIPFLILAALLPLFGGGPTTQVLGIDLSIAGLWDAWNIVAKATLGLLIATVLAATTDVTEFLAGMDGLRVPSVVTAIAGFMVRYVDVVAGDWSRMRIAMASRGHDPRWFTQIGPYARTLGVMFVRTFERGERVYLAMASRGYTGTMPASVQPATPAAQWWAGIAIVAAFWTVAATAWSLR
jgi:cobalt/nickel transport system permease protein